MRTKWQEVRFIDTNRFIWTVNFKEALVQEMIRVYFYVIAVEPDIHSNQVVFSDIMLFIKLFFRPIKQMT